MDALFDAIRFEMDSEEGQMARGQLLLERPDEVLPNKIDAFITRDWPQVAPNKFPPGYQVSESTISAKLLQISCCNCFGNTMFDPCC